MELAFGLRGRRLALITVAIFAVAGGIAYASIPDAGTGVYHACLAKDGKIQIIDPAADQCKNNETEITFNQQGPRGIPGAPGVNPTVRQIAAGDEHCAAGGAAITDAANTTAYVCNGAAGTNGQPFSGTFTSPNGQYSIAVTDTGVTMSGAGNTVGVDATGVRVDTHASGSVTVMSSNGLTLRSGSNATLEGSANVTVKGGAEATVQGGATTSITGSLVTINGGGQPAARVGDTVNGSTIVSGSPTVLIGG